MKQGIHNVPMQEYLAMPGTLSRGGVMCLNERTPRHFKVDYIDGRRASTHTAETDVGRAVHSLTQRTGDDPVHFVKADNWRTKAAREERDKIRSEGGVPLLEKQREQVEMMSSAMRDAMLTLLGIDLGESEQTIVWEEDGVTFRTRPDIVGRFIVDLKTTESVSAWPRKMMIQGGYDVQAAMQQRGFREVTGENRDVVWLVQEREYPFLVRPIGASTSIIELGTKKIERAKMIYKRCSEKNIWPGYPEDIDWVSPPAWAEMQQEDIDQPAWKELYK